MSNKWVKLTASSTSTSGYVNLDNVIALRVIPTIANPNVYVIFAYFVEGGGAGDTLDGTYASSALADEALARLTQGYDPS